jgi:hypothetical protein
MKKKILILACSFALVSFLLIPLQSILATSDAADSGALLQEVGTETGLGSSGDGQTQLVKIITTVINVILSLLGVILFVLIVYGGVLWMTSRGNEENVKKAKDIITDAIIGLVIVLAAYAISAYVVDALVKATAP